MPSVTYNGYTLPNVIGKFSVSENEKNFSFACSFLITAASEGALVAACQAAESALTEKNKDFSLSFGGSGEFSFSHDSNTGFLARPNLTKITNKLATGCSRPYKFSVVIQLPFSQSGYNYRREGRFTVSWDAARRRTFSFTCLYTAGGGDTAREKYQADNGGIAWAEGVLSNLGIGNFERISQNFSEEHEEKILNASLVYREILSYQKSGTYDVASIVDPKCSYSVDLAQNVGISPTAQYTMEPSVVVAVSFSCYINREDKSETSLLEDYESLVKPWLLNHSRDMLRLAAYSQAGTQFIIQSERKSVDPYTNSISGNLRFMVPKTSSMIIELSETISVSETPAIHAEKLWSGVPYTYNVWSLGAEKRLSRTITIRKLGSPPEAPLSYVGDEPGSWLLMSSTSRKEVQKHGVGTSDSATPIRQIYVYSAVYSEEYLYVEEMGGEII